MNRPSTSALPRAACRRFTAFLSLSGAAYVATKSHNADRAEGVQFLIGLETAGDDHMETIHRETVDLYEKAHHPRFPPRERSYTGR